MKLVIDTKNRIVGYASVGDMANAIDFEGEVPPDFELNFLPGKYLLKNGVIEVDDQFKIDDYTVMPTKEQQIIMQHVASLSGIQQVIMTLAATQAAAAREEK